MASRNALPTGFGLLGPILLKTLPLTLTSPIDMPGIHEKAIQLQLDEEHTFLDLNLVKAEHRE